MKIDFKIQSNVILTKYLNDIVYSLKKKHITANFFNIRCGVCGDSKSKPNKLSAYILNGDLEREPFYYCHKCGYKNKVSKWMKEFYPEIYSSYIKEVLSSKKDNVKVDIKYTKPTETYDEKEDTKYFIPILKGTGEIFVKAINYCNERKIPAEVYSKWYVAVDGLFKNRLIITFYDNKGKIYYYQGRSLAKFDTVKYMSRKGENLNAIYNIHNIDCDNPVFVFEGPIDSIFVENSIGLTGLKVNDERINHIKQKYFILDNDDAGFNIAKKLIKKGNYIFNWKKFLAKYDMDKDSVKDMNDFVMLNSKNINLTKDDILDCFSNDPIDLIYF